MRSSIKPLAWVAGFAALICASASSRAEEAPTFHKDIQPLLQKHCQSCHRPGESAPMALLDYAGARPWVKSIKKSIHEKTMPPWHADPNHGTFANDRRLSEAEIATFTKWAEAGAPEGNPADAPAPLKFVDGWGLGQEPDLVITMAQPHEVPATGIVDYQNLRMPPFPEDRWVKKIEIRPSNRNVAHHINVFRQLPGEDAKRQKEFVTGYVPGGIVTEYPEGTGLFFPKGTVVILQAHYVTTGKVESDQASVGFVFCREPVEKQIYNFLISNYTFAIPPGDPNYEVHAQWKTLEPVTVIGTMVHMHLRGKDYLYKAKYPDGGEEILMSVPKYDFNWQMGYHFKDRPKLPAKTVVEGIAHMDNSAGNPHNPDPAATVKYGPQTADEMIMGFIFFTKDGESLSDNRGKENLGPLSPEVGQAGKAAGSSAGQ